MKKIVTICVLIASLVMSCMASYAQIPEYDGAFYDEGEVIDREIYEDGIALLESSEPEYIAFDFCDETAAGNEIAASGFSYSGMSAPSVRPVSTGGFGINLRCYRGNGGYNPEPTVTFSRKINAEKYPYAKIYIGYENVMSPLNSLPMTSYIKLEGAQKTNVATISTDGQSITPVIGTAFSKSDYAVTNTDAHFVSIIAQLNLKKETNPSENVSGDVSVTFSPATSDDTDRKSINCIAVLKHIAFFKTQDAAQKYDATVSSVSYLHEDTEYKMTLDPIKHTAFVELPKGIIDEETFSTNNIAFKLADSRCTKTAKDYSGTNEFGINYTVSTLDQKSLDWVADIKCTQPTQQNILNMIAAFATITPETETDFLNEYEWILNKKSADYKNLESQFKSAFLMAMKAGAASLTPDNYEEVIKNEAFYSKVKSDGTAEGFKTILENSDYNENICFKTYKDYLDDTTRTAVFENAINCATYSEFLNNMQEKSFVTAINSALSYETVKDVFEANLEYMGYDTGEYEALCENTDNLAKVYMNLIGMEFASSADISRRFNESIFEVGITPDEQPKNIGGGGGGGPASPSIKQIASPAVNVETTVRPPVQQVIPAQKEAFSDIADVAWAKDSIMRLYNNKVINGKDKNIFAPHDRVSREEFVKMLACALNIETDDNDKLSFDDTDNNAWYAKYVAAAVKNEIVSGISASEFGTGKDIKREDMAVIADRAIRKLYGEYSDESAEEFADEDEISQYANQAVKALCAKGVITGDNGRFMPRESATRAQCAVIIDRLVTLVKSL